MLTYADVCGALAQAAEIVNIILACGVVYEMGNFSLGVSILAIGIGMQVDRERESDR